MANLSKLVLPVKNQSTGVITNQEFDLPSGGGGASDSKMDKANPTGTGSFSLNRKANTTVGTNSVAVGIDCTASGDYSVAIGSRVSATAKGAHAEGYTSETNTNYGTITASGMGAHAEGFASVYNGTITASGVGAHAEGCVNSNSTHSASGQGSHVEGSSCTASGDYAHAEGYRTTAGSADSHAEGFYTTASGGGAHAEGCHTEASGDYAHAEGFYTTANETYAHAEGCYTEASTNKGAHAEGCGYSGIYKVKATGKGAHAEGVAHTNKGVLASGDASHAEGYATTASNTAAHAEGYATTANNVGAHAEGSNTTANGSYSHAEGDSTKARGSCSHAGGGHGNADRPYQFVQGGGVIEKFASVMPSNGKAMFGFQPSPNAYSTDFTIADGQNGCSACLSGTAAVTIYLEPGGMYLLFCSSFTASTGAGYASTARMITATGTDTGTPANLSLGQTSNAPATISVGKDQTLTIKNSAAARVTEFHLIRIL